MQGEGGIPAGGEALAAARAAQLVRAAHRPADGDGRLLGVAEDREGNDELELAAGQPPVMADAFTKDRLEMEQGLDLRIGMRLAGRIHGVAL